MAGKALKGSAVLFSEMTPDASFEARFNTWYDEEHIPVRMACPGFASAQRYEHRDGDGYLAVYELADTGVLSTDDYMKVKNNPSDETRWMLENVTGFTRYLAGETSVRLQDGVAADEGLDAPVIHAIWFTVPPSDRAEFNDWYETEHIPLLMNNKDWLMVRRFEVADGHPESFTHLSIHYLRSEDALSSPERQAARNTEWRARLAERDWFKAKYDVFLRHGERQQGQHRRARLIDLRVRPNTVQNQTVEKLREAILAGVFKPGDRLVEAQLCSMLGVSRPSVREALRSLAAERLVAFVPNRGTQIPLLPWSEARDIYHVPRDA